MSHTTTTPYAVRSGRVTTHRPRVGTARRPVKAAASVLLALTGIATLGACGDGGPSLTDLPSDVASARPTISAEEASFVLAAEKLGATVSGATVADDIETGTTTCWVLRNGGVTLDKVAVDENDTPLPNTGDALRTKQLMAAGVQTFCPDHDDQIALLKLP
ncbi:MAG TPA: hypothetical protein VFN43_02855 [Humibacillus sp.]|nr:hypothetical protein [Humibacillus sp.]